MYINDVPVKHLSTIIHEVERCLSCGVAITGGEPLLVIDRVLEVSRFLKEYFGPDFHIHMYTNIRVLDRRRAQLLAQCSIDELRIHVLSPEVVQAKLHLLKYMAKLHFDLGLEVPVLPGLEDVIMQIVEELYTHDIISFVNLNEADVSAGNERALLEHGYRPSPDGTVMRSYEVGRELARRIHEKFPDLGVNLCPSKTKDLVQIGLRYFYKSFYMSTLRQRVEDDGTVTTVRSPEGVFTHPGNFARGLTYRYIPRTDKLELVEVT